MAARKRHESKTSHWHLKLLLSIFLVSCFLLYDRFPNVVVSNASQSLRLSKSSSFNDVRSHALAVNGDLEKCCRGLDQVEFWGPALNWGAYLRVNSSRECCQACKNMCRNNHGTCACDSWVFCGNKKECGSDFGQCWLKKQRDSLRPDVEAFGGTVIWTSGLMFGVGQGVVGLETDYGLLRIQLFPECAPRSVAYILELLRVHHCTGCHLYRAEGRGSSWDSNGNHMANANFGPPFALIQGTLESVGVAFVTIPREECLPIRRGSVAWIGSGPEFFLSLADHREWKESYTVFGSVLPEDMKIAESIAILPTKADVWSNISVSLLEKHIDLRFARISSKMSERNF